MTKTGPNTKNNLQNRRKASRQSQNIEKDKKSQEIEEIVHSIVARWFSSCHDGSACWPRKKSEYFSSKSTYRATMVLIMVRWTYLATKLMKRT
ncbi:hypothetical protein QL285_081951 [Trifolium repens]|nr:hypothetical protein QL285_081949 [Trifolium repens]KAK2368779.1 hypothetical protein QL285_081951 [Trifolium repens]